MHSAEVSVDLDSLDSKLFFDASCNECGVAGIIQERVYFHLSVWLVLVVQDHR